MKLKLLIADKYELFREGLAKLLADELGIEVVCTCGTEWEAAAIEHQPDIILIDTELSKYSGIESIQHIHKRLPNAKIVVLTHSEEKGDLYASVGAGASAYISKSISFENLLRVTTLVAEGEIILSPEMAVGLIAKFNSSKGSKEITESRDDITMGKREWDVLSLVAKGFTNREIAAALYISEHTVKSHLRNIMVKLHVHNRQQAVVLAEGKGLSPRGK